MLEAIVVILALAVAAFAASRLFPAATAEVIARAQRLVLGLKLERERALGHEIVYLTGGRGEPLLLLHGFDAGKESWLWTFPHLKRHFHVTAPDLPGFGDSSRDASASYAVEEQVDRVHALTEALGLTSFHLGGHSMGGAIAGLYAARYPNRVKSLWLLAPYAVRSIQPSEREELLRNGEDVMLVDSEQSYERLMEISSVKRPYIPGASERVWVERLVDSRDWYAKIVRDASKTPTDLEASLRNLPVPTLILWGAQDRVNHVSGAEVLELAMPNARAIVMPDTGHLPMMERPRVAVRHYLRFQGLAEPHPSSRPWRWLRRAARLNP